MFDMRQTKEQIAEGGMKLHEQLVDALEENERLRHRIDEAFRLLHDGAHTRALQVLAGEFDDEQSREPTT